MQVSGILYHFLIAYLLFWSGSEAIENYATNQLNWTMIEGFLGGIKAKEIGYYLKFYIQRLIH